MWMRFFPELKRTRSLEREEALAPSS